jgi:hypothetical protein
MLWGCGAITLSIARQLFLIDPDAWRPNHVLSRIGISLMISAHLVDIDELALHSRNEKARLYLSEGVACYKAGAFRACIVTTWIAVVFDFLAKLDELASMGDKNARGRLDEFEQIRVAQDIKKSMEFERQIPEMARQEFLFISAIEQEDLVRLHQDRHRCAHPSMNRDGEAYRPTAELARCHLRNAVEHLLMHPPVQGKAALDYLMQQVSSDYFPSDTEKAIDVFSAGPLTNPRDALIRNFAHSLLKKALLDDLKSGELQRLIAALNALRNLHVQVTNNALMEKLDTVCSRVDDNNMGRILELLGRVPDTLQYIGLVEVGVITP